MSLSKVSYLFKILLTCCFLASHCSIPKISAITVSRSPGVITESRLISSWLAMAVESSRLSLSPKILSNLAWVWVNKRSDMSSPSHSSFRTSRFPFVIERFAIKIERLCSRVTATAIESERSFISNSGRFLALPKRAYRTESTMTDDFPAPLVPTTVAVCTPERSKTTFPS